MYTHLLDRYIGYAKGLGHDLKRARAARGHSSARLQRSPSALALLGVRDVVRGLSLCSKLDN